VNAGWSIAAIACLAVLVIFGGYILALVIADTIRGHLNDRRDARDVKRGVL
jgi:hypothetical protein